ncbi:MAG: hypothetical protein HRU20_19630 [Pseudomonadales bacterium]|nr:hypothetical protein [Pseudomonadales bacterium]
MKLTSVLTLALIALLLSACGEKKQDKPVQAKTTILAPQIQALNKAKGVEALLQENTKKRLQELDQQTQ